MYIKSLSAIFILSSLFCNFSLEAMLDENEVRNRKYLAIHKLPEYKQRKLNNFLNDPTSHGPVLLFLDYFDIQYPGYSQEVNYLEEFLNLLDPKADVGEGSRLVFYTPEIYQACLPKQPSDYTPAFCQLGVYTNLAVSLPILRGLTPGDFQEVCQYVKRNLDIFKTGRSIYHFLKWYKILSPQDRLDMLTTMYTKFQNWIPYANCPFSSEEYLYRRLQQIKDPIVRDLVLSRILANSTTHDFHGITEAYVSSLIDEVMPISG